MQKLKQNANFVGATSSRPPIEGMTLKNKGITLIALIITIIVMLILVGVTINVALNGGLFQKADTAAKQTQKEVEKEVLQSAVIAALNDELKIEKVQDIQDNLPSGWTVTGVDGGPYTCTSPKGNTFIVNENGKIEDKNGSGGSGGASGTDLPDGALITMYRAGESCEEENCTNEEHLHVGDYVSYNPDTDVTTYYPDGEDSTNIGANTGYTEAAGATSLQVVEQETLNWRVLGASGDNVLLISETPTTTGIISLYGHIGYNNWETILNTACSTLYSKTGVGTARSITMSDIDIYLDGNNYDKTTFDDETGSGYYGYANENIISKFDYNSSTNILTKLPEGETKILSLTSNAYYYMANEYITDPIKLNLLQGSNSDYVYGIASRTIWLTDEITFWCMNCFEEGGVFCASNSFCDSNGNEGRRPAPLRPVVTLSSNVTTSDVSKVLSAQSES